MCVISDTSWEEAEDVIADHNDEVMTTWRDLRWRPRLEKKHLERRSRKKPGWGGGVNWVIRKLKLNPTIRNFIREMLNEWN